MNPPAPVGMSMALEWSFSIDRSLRRCQRQAYLSSIVASHNARDPLRREAHLRKQVKTLDLWRGSLVHAAIEHFVVPAWQARSNVDWDDVIARMRRMALVQVEFSRARRYREPGLTKANYPESYRALREHEQGDGLSPHALESALGVAEMALRNLQSMQDFLAHVGKRDKYWPELHLRVDYDGVTVLAGIDLLFFRGFNQPTIVDWKTHAGVVGPDGRLQTALYAWALHRHPKWRQPRPTDIELFEVDLNTAHAVRHEVNIDQFTELEDRIYRSIQDLRALFGDGRYDPDVFDSLPYATNPNNCRYCSFAQLCIGAQDVRASSQSLRNPEPLRLAL
jgi:hypothetical protein